MSIKEMAKGLEQYIIDCRRWLHAHPELSGKEIETTRFLVAELEKMGFPTSNMKGSPAVSPSLKAVSPARL